MVTGMVRNSKWRFSAGALALTAVLTVPMPAALLIAQAAPQWPVRIRDDMIRLGGIEWRLRTAARASCPRTAPDIGVTIDDRRAYDRRDWPMLERTVGLRENPVLIGVVKDGPADHAGLRAGDELLAIGSVSVDAIAERRQAGSLVAEALLEEVAASKPGVAIALTVRRAGSVRNVTVDPALHCAARLVLVTDRGVDAHSDSHNVAISSGLIAMARSDDEIALAAGHELAHITLQHRKGGGISERRRMEDAADSLGLQLMHCARYDAARGLGLFRRLGKGDWLGFLRAPTHRSFAKRVARLEDELPGLTCPVSTADGHGKQR